MQHTLFGRKVLLENLNNPQVAHVDLAKNNHDLIAKLKAHHIHFQIRDDAFFKQFPSKLIHQGIMIVMKDTNLVNNLDDLMINLHNKAKSIIVIIDSIQDAQNFGSILRTCEAFGVDAVIYKKDQQVQLNDFVSKSSMGATQYLNLIRVSNLLNVINTLKVNKYWIYASTFTNKSERYLNIKYQKKCALIIGNETNGISSLLIKESDFEINIPMYGKIQSLNAAVATGILLGEIKRQNLN